MQAEATTVRSRKDEVLGFFQKRERDGEPPYDDVLDLFYHMKIRVPTSTMSV